MLHGACARLSGVVAEVDGVLRTSSEDDSSTHSAPVPLRRTSRERSEFGHSEVKRGAERHLATEKAFLLDMEVAAYIGWPTYNALKDPNNKGFEVPDAGKV